MSSISEKEALKDWAFFKWTQEGLPRAERISKCCSQTKETAERYGRATWHSEVTQRQSDTATKQSG